jgi:hypothetical protein
MPFVASNKEQARTPAPVRIGTRGPVLVKAGGDLSDSTGTMNVMTTRSREATGATGV